MGCPNCGKKGIGGLVVMLTTRGTQQDLEATVCHCGTVFVSDEQREELREKQQNMLKDEMRENGLSEEEISEVGR